MVSGTTVLRGRGNGERGRELEAGSRVKEFDSSWSRADRSRLGQAGREDSAGLACTDDVSSDQSPALLSRSAELSQPATKDQLPVTDREADALRHPQPPVPDPRSPFPDPHHFRGPDPIA
ncbi:MAG: hypothetical protein WA996_22680 [Candidatus Promineifilaceae bacterium]